MTHIDTYRTIHAHTRAAREDLVFILTRSADMPQPIREALQRALTAVNGAGELAADAQWAEIRADNARRDAAAAAARAKLQP